MESCVSLMAGGYDKNCPIPFKSIRDVLIFDKDSRDFETINGGADFYAQVETLIGQGKAFYAQLVSAPENTTSDSNENEQGNGLKYLSSKPYQSYNLKLKGAFCSGNSYFNSFRGGNYGIAFIGLNGEIYIGTSTDKINSTIPRAYSVNLDSQNKGFTESADDYFMLKCYHTDYESMNNSLKLTTSKSALSLIDVMPVPAKIFNVELSGSAIKFDILDDSLPTLTEAEIEIVSVSAGMDLAVAAPTVTGNSYTFDVTNSGVIAKGNFQFRVLKEAEFVSDTYTLFFE